MKEIGGYIEFEHYHNKMLHEGAIALNCGRSCLSYLIKVRNITRIWIPKFLCDSVKEVCNKANVQIREYSISCEFLPILDNNENDWVYIVNYYGQLSDAVIKELIDKYDGKVILDYAQSYYQMPMEGIDTIYTCRKYFGVTDGAFLYSKNHMDQQLPVDESFCRVGFLMGRFERTAQEFYNQYRDNNELFRNEPVKRMSKLTNNLLRGIDYEKIRNTRNENFTYLHDKLRSINRLNLITPVGPFMYPLYIAHGTEIRQRLCENKVYIPVLWPNVLNDCKKTDLEYDMANNILPLPIDQRYGISDMEYIMEILDL